MKSVLKEEEQIHYIDSSDMINFIKKNSDMSHNEVCDYVREHDICDGEFGPALWLKEDIIKTPEEFNEIQVQWIGSFFEVHSWIKKMMIVFNN